jgi:MFS family permease
MRGLSTVKLLYIARGSRGFADGFATVILPAYLSAIGYDPVQIGVVLAAALFGTACLTLAIGVFARGHDLRGLLIGSACLMTLTGLAFPNFEQLALIIVIVFFGTINPSTGDLGVAVPLEHAMLARSVADEERTRAFARYSLTGALSAAAGTLALPLPSILTGLGINQISAFALMFYGYALLGIVNVLLYRRLPPARMGEASPHGSLGPSRKIVFKLAGLFSLDAFAGGFVVQSLLALWLFERFNLSLSAAGVFFFWSNTLSAFSYPVAAWLARRLGLVNTMVFTHIPSNVFLILAALTPNLYVALSLLLLRAALSQMDVPTRTSYVMAVVTPAERTAAASVTAVPRSLASALSPALAGVLLSSGFAGLPLIACGALKIVYDLSLLFSFRHVKPPEELRSSTSK